MPPSPLATIALRLALVASGPVDDAPDWPHFAHPNWSPRGDLIAIDCGPGGELDLCLFHVRSGRVERLTATADMQEAVPVFSADGRRISFSRERDGAWYLAVLDLDSREVTELAELDMPYASSSSWAPAGDRLAFDALNGDGDHDIFTVRLDGSDRRLLIGGPGSQRFATYSPDGRRLAFTRIVDNSGDIMVAATDGSGARAVTTDDADEGVPIWSPDGSRLSFYRNLDGNLEIFITDLEGHEVRLTHDPAYDVFATFAPDGRSLVFESTRSRNPSGFDRGADLFQLDLETLELERLTEPGAFPKGVGFE